MLQPQKKGWLASLSPMTRTLLGVVIIAIIVVLGVAYGPHYSDSSTTTGDAPPATPTVTGMLASLQVNRNIVRQGVTIAITDVTQAQTFSDDNKSSYAHVKYILRVRLHVQAPANQQGAIGIDYCKLSHVVLTDGSQLSCKLAQISPDVLPGQNEEGFLDFWSNTQYSLPALRFTLGADSIAFG